MTTKYIKQQAKAAAKVLPAFVERHPLPWTHTHCLEFVSRLHGYPSWHVASSREDVARDAVEEAQTQQRPEVGPWRCDRCGDEIKTAGDGYVVWKRSNGKQHDFLIVHKVKCDPQRDYHSSAALGDFLGQRGLAKLLSFLSIGPIMARGREFGPDVASTSEFTHLVRRVQTPFYEQVWRYFDDPDWQERLAGWNEYAPYLPDELLAMTRWAIRDCPADAPHLGLTQQVFAGEMTVAFDHEPLVLTVGDAVFGRTSLRLAAQHSVRASMEAELQLCADAAFRGSTRLVLDDEEADVEIELKLVSEDRLHPSMTGAVSDREGSVPVQMELSRDELATTARYAR